jgi:hypothetical protein
MWGYSNPASALDFDIRNSYANVLDFSFIIDHSTVDLMENGTPIKTNINRVGILVFDIPENGLHFGLALGYAFGDFNNNPLFQPIDMDGLYIGVLARGVAYESARMALTMEGRYFYQDMSGSDETRNASLSWDEYSLNVTLHVALSGTLRFFAAPVYGDVDARYRERGADNLTVKLESESNAGFLAGLHYKVERREFISLQYQDHVFTGVMLRFRRFF